MTGQRPAPGATGRAVPGLSKKLCRALRTSHWYGVRDIARDLLPRGDAVGDAVGDAALRPGECWALRDISFALRRDESLAVTGPNAPLPALRRAHDGEPARTADPAARPRGAGAAPGRRVADADFPQAFLEQFVGRAEALPCDPLYAPTPRTTC